MPINKIDRKELKEMLVDILSKSATFKMLSKDNEVNPCRISFDGMEFHIYQESLTSSTFKQQSRHLAYSVANKGRFQTTERKRHSIYRTWLR